MSRFAEAVYTTIRRIPPGMVMTYAGVAHALCKPRAARAVGNALNRNPVLVATPCHRVVRSDGAVGGYAGGVARKVTLLQREGVVVQAGRVDLARYEYRHEK